MRTFTMFVSTFLLVAPPSAHAQSALLVRPDAEALIEIDGRPATAASVLPWQVYEFPVEPGEHLVSALTPDRRDRWEQVVTALENSKVFVLAALAPVTKERETGERATQAGGARLAEISRLEQQLERLRERKDFELLQARQAARNAEASRNAPATTDWLSGLNSLVGHLGDGSAATHQINAEKIDQEIAVVEQRIERLRSERQF